MLSILIPVFNFDIREFVQELHKQASGCGIDFEIRCYDDKSDENFRLKNREVSGLTHVVYRELPENTGRAAIRNLLAAEAKYDYLLFLDCDSFPEYPDFISRYVKLLNPACLLYGGRTYSPRKPTDSKFLLHWKYGSRREVIPVEKRRAKPYHSFQTNNFVVPRSIFRAIGLNEGLKGYGHEDTQFGQQLLARQIEIVHLDNPLRHLGLETPEEFLNKTHQGIKNLYYLIYHGYEVSTIKLARYYKMLKTFHVDAFAGALIKTIEKKIMRNLFSDSPSLFLFDLYKLGKLIEAGKDKHKHLP